SYLEVGTKSKEYKTLLKHAGLLLWPRLATGSAGSELETEPYLDHSPIMPSHIIDHSSYPMYDLDHICINHAISHICSSHASSMPSCNDVLIMPLPLWLTLLLWSRPSCIVTPVCYAKCGPIPAPDGASTPIA